MVPRSAKAHKREEMIAKVDSPDYDAFEDGPFEQVVGKGRATPPISIRLSKPLLERLDNLAVKQHRSRSNLIQHILWAHVLEEN